MPNNICKSYFRILQRKKVFFVRRNFINDILETKKRNYRKLVVYTLCIIWNNTCKFLPRISQTKKIFFVRPVLTSTIRQFTMIKLFASSANRRRAEANFPGASTILSQIKNGARKKRIGMMLGQGPPARENAAILTLEGEKVGHVTSGGPTPTLGRPIAMGYVPSNLAHNGGGVLVEVRGKTYKATVTKMPFVKTNYYTGK